MAQKDIKAMADYMNSINESIAEEDRAYDRACREADAFYSEEDALIADELEDEIIDKTLMGFIDDADDDIENEADVFYNEDDEDAYEEDISIYAEDPFNEAEADDLHGSILIEVYNEDGFGDHFILNLMDSVDDVEALQIGTNSSGDIVVNVSGLKEDLEKAYAFYLGHNSFADLPDDDKNEFRSLLTFDDGDTLAEADYREALAHSLDPLGIEASTANLKAQDVCLVSTLREERMRRKVDKSFKFIKENDLSNVDDDTLEVLGAMEDCAEEGNTSSEDIEEKLEQTSDVSNEAFDTVLHKLGFKNKAEWDARSEDDRIILSYIAQFGYTAPEYDKLDPEQQDELLQKCIEQHLSLINSRKPNYMTKTDMKRLQRKNDRENRELMQQSMIHKAIDNIFSVLDCTPEEWDNMSPTEQEAALKNIERSKRDELLRNLTLEMREDLISELVDEIRDENKGDPEKTAKEIMYVKRRFGQNAMTYDDIAPAFGVVKSGIKKAIAKLLNDITDAIKRAGGINASPDRLKAELKNRKIAPTFRNTSDILGDKLVDILYSKILDARKCSIAVDYINKLCDKATWKTQAPFTAKKITFYTVADMLNLTDPESIETVNSLIACIEDCLESILLAKDVLSLAEVLNDPQLYDKFIRAFNSKIVDGLK